MIRTRDWRISSGLEGRFLLYLAFSELPQALRKSDELSGQVNGGRISRKDMRIRI